MSERITINAPDGTSPEVYQCALGVALTFATSYLDRQPGQRRAVVYSDRWTAADWPTRGQRYDYIVWWTAGRAIVVRVVPVTA